RPGGGAPARHLEGAHLLRARTAFGPEEGRLPHARLARGGAQEVRQGEGPPFLPVLQALIAHPSISFKGRADRPALFVCVPNVVSHYVSSPPKRGPSKRWASRPRRPVIASNSATSRILVPRFRGDDRWSKGFRTMGDTNKPLTNDNAFRGPLKGGSMEPTFGGALSFMRRRYTRDLTGVDAVVWGIPFDQATSNRPGARFGPQAIRRASAIFDGDPQYPFGIDPFASLTVVDYGDCGFDYGRPAEIPAAIESQAAAILATDATLFTLGGDHFATYPLLRAHAA